MNRIFILSLFVFLQSCATGYRSESIDSKISRFKTREHNINTIPQIKPKQVVIKNKVRRGPASAEIKEDFSKYSNRRIYFLALYDQYLQFRSYTGNQTPQVKYCPQFHSSLVKEELYKKEYSSKFLDPKYKDQNADSPEAFLPLSDKNLEPIVADYLNKENYSEVVSKALQIHSYKLYGEIKELCEHGKSYNYFIFANIISHVDKTQPKKDFDLIKMLYKTSLFSNRAVLTSLKQKVMRGRFPASVGSFLSYEKEAYKRLKGNWFDDYFKTLEVSTGLVK